MKLFKIISRVDVKSFWKLFKLCLPNLLFLWPTYSATKHCMSISNSHFGRKHYQNGQANAFRHALWNILITKNCMGLSSNLKKALRWAKEITDWHEEAFFSQELPMKMDYHNNEVGRNLVETHSSFTINQFVDVLLKMTQNAIKIKETMNLNQLKNQLVYITDDH